MLIPLIPFYWYPCISGRPLEPEVCLYWIVKSLVSKLLLLFSSKGTLWFLLVDVFLNITNRGISPPTYSFLSIIVDTSVLQILLSKGSLIAQSGREGAGGGHEKTREWTAALCWKLFNLHTMMALLSWEVLKLASSPKFSWSSI